MDSDARVKRSWGTTIVWIAAAGLCLTGAAYFGHMAWTNDGWRDLVGWPLAVVLGLGGLISLVGIFTASGSARCPGCGGAITGFDATRGSDLVILCTQCKSHASPVDGTLRLLPLDHVHASPAFTAKLEAEVRWPGCVMCNGPATVERVHELREGQMGKNAAASAVGITLFAVAGAGFIQTGGGKVWRIPVPYCEAHRDAVALDTDFGTPVIRFRSYSAFRAYCEANNLSPIAPSV